MAKRRKSKKGGRKRRFGFKYRRRGKESYSKRANQRGGVYDPYLVEKFDVFTAKEGDNSIRILPPTWDDSEHYGLDIFVHYQVGTDNQALLCPKHHGGADCPICTERLVAQQAGDDEYARECAPTKRVLVYCIDRADENSGPKLYPMPWTLDRDIVQLCRDKRTGEVVHIDDPDQGYDVEFTRVGTGQRTKYTGLQISRKSSPLTDDVEQGEEWLQLISDTPLPDCLIVHDAEYVGNLFAGKKSADDEDEEEEVETRSGRRRPRDVDDEEDVAYDEDEDADLEFDDDEADEDDDEADEDDDEADEDEEDEDDDEEDEDEEDEDEDEDDELTTRRGKSSRRSAKSVAEKTRARMKPRRKGAKKRRR